MTFFLLRMGSSSSSPAPPPPPLPSLLLCEEGNDFLAHISTTRPSDGIEVVITFGLRLADKIMHELEGAYWRERSRNVNRSFYFFSGGGHLSARPIKRDSCTDLPLTDCVNPGETIACNTFAVDRDSSLLRSSVPGSPFPPSCRFFSGLINIDSPFDFPSIALSLHFFPADLDLSCAQLS